MWREKCSAGRTYFLFKIFFLSFMSPLALEKLYYSFLRLWNSKSYAGISICPVTHAQRFHHCLEPDGNCLQDGYTVALIYQKIFWDGVCMTIIYHFVIILGAEMVIFFSQVRHLINSNTHSEDLYGYILKLLPILFSWLVWIHLSASLFVCYTLRELSCILFGHYC